MDAVKDLLAGLPFEDQEELHAYLTRILTPAEVERAPLVATVRTRTATVTYRAERVRCGRKTCACRREGKLHGPYVYKYWREDGRLRKKYVGKNHPAPRGAGKPRA